MKKVLSLLIALVLMMGVTATGFAAPETIEGDSTVDSVVINVLAPTNLNFALNPLELGDLSVEGSQIRSADYLIVNKTEAPVKVTFDLAVVPKDNSVTLVDDNSTLEKDDDSVDDKEIYFAAIGATGIAEVNDLDFDYVATAGVTAPKFTYDTEKAETLVGFKVVTEEGADEGKAKGSIVFALDAATDETKIDPAVVVPDTLAAGNKGVASFQFYGEMNTYADWAASDVKITGTYTLTALRGSTYDGYATDEKYAEDGLNQLKGTDQEPAYDVKIAAGDRKSLTVARATVPTTGYKVYLADKPASVTSYQCGTPVYVSGTDYTYDAGVITVTRITPNASAVVTISAGGNTYTIDLTVTG